MQITRFSFSINLDVNLQTIRFEGQMHFKFSLKELHPSAALAMFYGTTRFYYLLTNTGFISNDIVFRL
jgi:hypothetical protein